MSTNIQTTAIRQIDRAAWTPRAARLAKRNTDYSLARAAELRQTADRRASHRYPIDLPVKYEIGRGDRAQGGKGRVINFSSTGLLIESDCPLSCGTAIRLRVEWPVRLNNSIPLGLHIEGRSVRVQGLLVAVRIVKSEFRIRPCHAMAAVRQAG